jgi:phage terminase large subunit-like protein
MIPIPQTISGMAPPTKEFESFLLKGLIAHDGNPVLRWMIKNAAIKEDSEGNYKPDKKKSSEKIDGVVAAIMGFDRATRNTKQQSIYSTRGIQTVGE